VEKIFKTIPFEIKDINRDEQTLWAVGTTESFDRDDDIIRMDGWEIDNYLKNPVILWAHNYREPPIGKALQVEPQASGMWFKVQFAKTDKAQEVFGLYADGFMRAWSVGFLPKDYDHLRDDAGQPLGGWDYMRQELLELSAVPVPANPEALNILRSKGVFKGMSEELISDLTGQMDLISKTVIPFRAHPKDSEDADWNGPREVAAAEVSDLKIMCTWYDAEKPDIKGSYKLPHHRASGHNSVWRGVAVAMAVLFGARGGVQIPAGDRKGCYNHLAKEYKHHGKDPPEYKTLETLAGMLDEETSEAVEFVLLKICGIDAYPPEGAGDEQSAGLPPADAGKTGELATEETLPDDVAEELLEAVKGIRRFIQ
jgi:HK97 family phage prohead protease